jgi:hypothetical protein
MFMGYRGGGIGHKATQEWNDILQHEGHGAEEVVEADEGDLDIDVGENHSEEEDVENLWDDEGDGNDEGDGDDEDDEDCVLADEGEELDDNILAEEGYGAL